MLRGYRNATCYRRRMSGCVKSCLITPIRFALSICILLAALNHSAASNAALIPVELRCEWATSPSGVDAVQPGLLWKLESNGRGQRQNSYQILAVGLTRFDGHLVEGCAWVCFSSVGFQSPQVFDNRVNCGGALGCSIFRRSRRSRWLLRLSWRSRL